MWTALWSALALCRLARSVPNSPAESYPPSYAFSTELELRDKVRYELPVLIGSPSQAFSLAIDTTVAYIAVFDSDCSECGKGPKYSGKDSNTYQLVSSGTFLNVTGVRGKDTVLVAGLAVPDQDIVSVLGNAGGALHSPVGVLVWCM